jgi:hypothetical protein
MMLISLLAEGSYSCIGVTFLAAGNTLVAGFCSCMGVIFLAAGEVLQPPGGYSYLPSCWGVL